jgi:hypothetical protein
VLLPCAGTFAQTHSLVDSGSQQFGQAVALYSNLLIVSGTQSSVGQLIVYRYIDGTHGTGTDAGWAVKATLVPSDGAANHNFASSNAALVSFDRVVLVGSSGRWWTGLPSNNLRVWKAATREPTQRTSNMGS